MKLLGFIPVLVAHLCLTFVFTFSIIISVEWAEANQIAPPLLTEASHHPPALVMEENLHKCEIRSILVSTVKKRLYTVPTVKKRLNSYETKALIIVSTVTKRLSSDQLSSKCSQS